MQKIIIFLITAFIIYSCGSDEQKDESASQNSIQDTAAESRIKDDADVVEVSEDEKFNLAYRFEQGQKIKYKLTSVAITNQKIESADSTIVNEVKQNSEYIFDISAANISNEGINLGLSITAVKITANFNGDILEFDSQSDNTQEAIQKFPEYASLPGNNFNVTINRQGRIIGLSDVEGIVNKYLELQNVPSIKEEERTQLMNQLRDQALQPLSQQLFKYLPNEEIKMDSTWVLNYSSQVGLFTLENRAISRISKVIEQDDEMVAVIETILHVDVSGDGTINRGGVTYNFADPVITGNATTHYNLELGLVTSSNSTTETETYIQISAANPNVETQSAQRTDLTVNTNYLELLEVN